MVEIAEIKDKDSLEAWLKGMPREFAATIATRAALRVLPFYWNWTVVSRHAKSQAVLMLSAFRCSLIALSFDRVPKSAAKVAIESYGQDVALARAYANEEHPYEHRKGALYPSFSGEVLVSTLMFAFDFGEPSSTLQSALSFSVNGLSGFGSSVPFREVLLDCRALEQGKNLREMSLWSSGDATEILWKDLKQRVMSEDNWQRGDQGFWVDWYDQMLDPITYPPNWALLEQVALIPDEIWEDGPEAVSAEIAELQSDFRALSEGASTSAAPALGTVPPQVVAETKGAMERNRRELPTTFDAISALILCEIERLQAKNYTSDLDQGECLRQIGVLVSLHDAIEGLRRNLPSTGPVSEQNAEESVSLVRLYYNELSSLPREKVDAVKEGVWDATVATGQFGLVGALSGIGIYYGLPATAAMTAAAYCVAPQKAGEILAAAKELLPIKS